MIVLASKSASRRAMLTAAGVDYEPAAPQVDEGEIKDALEAVRVAPRDLADALAEAKAVKISLRMPGRLVLGSDSLLVLADGTALDKPRSREEAAEHLRAMSGTPVRIVSAAVVAEDGQAVWRHVDEARLDVRRLGDAFLAGYLDAEWPAIAGCVGCFRIEGPGVQLFNAIAGSHFTVLGMPLRPVLDFLRRRGVLAA